MQIMVILYQFKIINQAKTNILDAKNLKRGKGKCSLYQMMGDRISGFVHVVTVSSVDAVKCDI